MTEDNEWKAILHIIIILTITIIVVLCIIWIFICICNCFIDCQAIINKIGI